VGHPEPTELAGRDDQPLTQWEIERLLARCSPLVLPDVRRLVAEVRTLRDTQAEREFFGEQEQEF
jgi:hypothetical protein